MYLLKYKMYYEKKIYCSTYSTLTEDNMCNVQCNLLCKTIFKYESTFDRLTGLTYCGSNHSLFAILDVKHALKLVYSAWLKEGNFDVWILVTALYIYLS